MDEIVTEKRTKNRIVFELRKVIKKHFKFTKKKNFAFYLGTLQNFGMLGEMMNIKKSEKNSNS